MCNNYTELAFNHFVVATSDGAIFGSATQNGNGRIYNFLILQEGVYAQNGEEWFTLDNEFAEIVRRKAEQAYSTAPVYKTDRLLFN